MLTTLVAALRGEVLLLGIAALLAVPSTFRLFPYLRSRRSGRWQWPTPSRVWPTGLLGVRGWLAAALGAVAIGLLAAALHIPAAVVTILGAAAGATALVAPPTPSARQPVAR